jgi:hypothetical protein
MSTNRRGDVTEQDEERGGITRRQVITRGAVVAGAVWTAPAIFSTAAHATAGSAAPVPGTVIVDNDEWTLSDAGFGEAPDAATFALNVANILAPGGGSLLAYSDNFGFTGSDLASTLTGAGYSFSASVAAPFTLATLQQYKGVFVGGDNLDNSVLAAYVAGGGNVYLAGGTGDDGAAGEAASWNPFLATVGLQLGSPYNGVEEVVPISSPAPLFAGVTGLYEDNGNPISLTAPVAGRNAQILVTDGSGDGLYAISTPA